MAFILLFAGFETTVNLIGNGVYALLRNPEQRDAAAGAPSPRARAALLATGVEELLRYDGPVELATWRFATEPLDHRRAADRGGRPGTGGARRRRPGPGAVRRTGHPRPRPARDNQHLGYGHGIHYCLGAPLARLEGQTALATLLQAPAGPAACGGSGRIAVAWGAHHAWTAHPAR